MRVLRQLLVPAVAILAVGPIQAQSDLVYSPLNVLKNGGFEVKDPDDRNVPGWNIETRGWSSGLFLGSAGASSLVPRAGTGAAYMTNLTGPSASVLYQEFTIAPIPVRDCRPFLNHRACSRLDFSFGTRDHSHLLANTPDVIDPRRNMTSLENYAGYHGDGPPPDYRDFPLTPPCIPTGYFDEFGNPLCEIGPETEFWYGAPNADTRQFATIDLLRGGADPFSMDSDDVLMTFFRGADSWFGGPQDFYGNPSLYDLDPVLRDGGTFMLRFGAVSNLYKFEFVVDEVGLGVYNEPLAAPPGVIPEPASIVLLASGLAAVAFVARRRRKE